MSTLAQVEMSPGGYIYISIVGETFRLSLPAGITKFYLYALELHFHWFKLWTSPADGEEAAAGKSILCNPTNETSLCVFSHVSCY